MHLFYNVKQYYIFFIYLQNICNWLIAGYLFRPINYYDAYLWICKIHFPLLRVIDVVNNFRSSHELCPFLMPIVYCPDKHFHVICCGNFLAWSQPKLTYLYHIIYITRYLILENVSFRIKESSLFVRGCHTQMCCIPYYYTIYFFLYKRQ